MTPRFEPRRHPHWNALRCRCDRRLAWHWHPLRIADRAFDLALPSDPDQVLTTVCRQTSNRSAADTSDPFWAQVWPSTRGIDRFLADRDLTALPVLELGCGVGAGGLAAVARGARVTFTDGATDPLLLLRLTLARNAIDGCTIRRLRFGIDRIDRRFSLIIGSDVTYLRHCWPGLLDTLASHLTPGGEVLLSDPYRSLVTEFVERVATPRWRVESHHVALDDTAIRVLRLTAQTLGKGFSDRA